MKAMKILAVTLINLSLLSGCSVQNKGSVNGAGSKGMTMKQILREKQGGGSSSSKPYAPQRRSTNQFNYMSYTRTAETELNGLFPSLPNPNLCPYITPHISVENSTIPGYTSCFPMYEKNHYALPGEVNAIWQ